MTQRRNHQVLTAERLREVLSYDPGTGSFCWLKTLSKRAVAGTPAGLGRNTYGYCRIGIDSVRYSAHQLAWVYMTGEFPNEIDHIDLDKGNNSWRNLRLATHKQNMVNRASYNALAVKGVRPHHRRFVAEITISGKTTYLGLFGTIQAASHAYSEAARQLHGEFSRS